MKEDIVVPIARGGVARATVTPPWFVNGSEYKPQLCQFELLVNGEAAFGAVHRAIEQAKKSVCIICWGFQPSMHLIRDGKSPPIGRLLIQKAAEGVQIRILSWEIWIDATLGPGRSPVSPVGKSIGESNTPGRWDFRLKEDRPPTSTDRQYKYDVAWYDLYDEDQEWTDKWDKEVREWLGDAKAENLRFRGRGFSHRDRANIATNQFEDRWLKIQTRGILAATPSHHQKMVIVDHESDEDHVGFVMGHNLLDGYWDTDAHSAQRSFILSGTPDPAPDRRANGSKPLEDFSSRVTGPIVGDLFRNFAQAWEKDSGESLAVPAFESYKARPIGTSHPITAQILRTQPQYGREDIKSLYLQAVSNATQYIYIENQYFRWPPLAEKIKEAAARHTAGGRKPEEHGSLHLFVITNSTDAGIGSGTVNTQRMLDSLGRADTLPEVTRLERSDTLDAQIEDAKDRVETIEAERKSLDNEVALYAGLPNTAQNITARYGPINERLDKAKAELAALEHQKTLNDDPAAEILAEERPGLKCHICTLVAPDTREGQAWVEVYIHAKLMLIDDAFMTLGSANINTRSMEVDSEMNITHHRPEISRPTRLRLWDLHTKGRGAQERVSDAFMEWGKLMEENAGRQEKKMRPIVSLTAFLRTSPERTDLD